MRRAATIAGLICCALGLPCTQPAPAGASWLSLAPSDAGQFGPGRLPLAGGRGAALASAQTLLADAPLASEQEPLTGATVPGPASLATAQPFAPLAGVPRMQVDGVSDQNLPRWDGNFGGGYFAGFFFANWQRRGAVRLARYFVPWNVTSGTGSNPKYLREYEAWYADAVETLHLTPVLSLTQYGAGPVPTSSFEYSQLVRALLARRHVSYLEAWNEPNNRPRITEAHAAAYFREARAACERYACTPIAGDFLDSASMASYEQGYVRALGSLRPLDWAVHPYVAVKEQNAEGIYQFIHGLPGAGAGLNVWFTEVGAYECQPAGSPEDSSGQQGIDASWLVNRLMPAIEPAHVFYFELLAGNHREVECPGRYEDTELYGSGYGPLDYPRPAANYVFDDRGQPAAYTGPANHVATSQATITGTVFPGGYFNTEYRFQYGTSAAYGSVTPLLPAGAGEQPVPVSAALTGLTPDATYHYRLLAFNREGSSDEGATAGDDETFHT